MKCLIHNSQHSAYMLRNTIDDHESITKINHKSEMLPVSFSTMYDVLRVTQNYQKIKYPKQGDVKIMCVMFVHQKKPLRK